MYYLVFSNLLFGQSNIVFKERILQIKFKNWLTLDTIRINYNNINKIDDYNITQLIDQCKKIDNSI